MKEAQEGGDFYSPAKKHGRKSLLTKEGDHEIRKRSATERFYRYRIPILCLLAPKPTDIETPKRTLLKGL